MPTTTVKMPIEDSKGLSRYDSDRINRPVKIYITCGIGNPGIFKELFSCVLNLNTPITANIGKMPNEKPI